LETGNPGKYKVNECKGGHYSAALAF